jgi:alpha-galactosidase
MSKKITTINIALCLWLLGCCACETTGYSGTVQTEREEMDSAGEVDSGSDLGDSEDSQGDSGFEVDIWEISGLLDDHETLKVFILAGQSNMVGKGTVEPTQAHLDRNGGQGTLVDLVNNAATRSTYAHLDGGNGAWAVRDDVWLVDLEASGPLTITGETFGPELQFGHVLGDYYENPVLIIKTSWGGKSLNVEFRPPSAGGTVGESYTEMVDRVHRVLGDIGEFYPGYSGQGYEIVGLGWHQGWNDRIDSEAVAAYQSNCVHLINDLRREFDASEMRFVIATTGMGGWEETHPRALALMEAQLAVPTDERLESGYVSAVETRDFWRDLSVSPADQGYHWNRNAETFFLIGNAMGTAMLDLIELP